MRLIDADALPITFDGHTVSVWKNDIDVAPTVNPYEWISVKDRLPDHDDWVLVCRQTIKTGYTTIVVDKCTLTVGGDRMWFSEYSTWQQVVTHWMPLPPLPKTEED